MVKINISRNITLLAFSFVGIMSINIIDTSNHHDQDFDKSNEVIQEKSMRIKVEFNRHGEAVGGNATHFKSQVGKFVKTFVPISYINWKNVPQNYKDDVWHEIVVSTKHFLDIIYYYHYVYLKHFK